VVERLVLEGERERVRLHKGRLDTCPLQVPARELELSRLDVDAGENEARKLLAEHCEHRACAGAYLEQARSGLELRTVADQAVPPVLRLLHEPLLLRCAVAVDVRAHHAQ
jgi:hypothetical protein